MTDFKAKMHQIRFRWGSAPDPAGELTELPRPPSWIWGPLRGRGRLGWGRGGKGAGKGKCRGGKGKAPSYCWTRVPQRLATPLPLNWTFLHTVPLSLPVYKARFMPVMR